MNPKQNPIKQIFQPTSCLEQKQMADYLDGKLNTDEIHLVERHLIDCPFCSDALEGMQQVGTGKFALMMEEVNQRIQLSLENPIPTTLTDSQPLPGRPKFPRIFMGIAASLLLMAVAGIFLLWPAGKNVRIADKYATGFSYSPTMSGSGTHSVFEKALEKYNQKDYAAAIPLFEGADDPAANFLKGISHFSLKNYQEAITLFEKEIDSQGKYLADAQWYSAMAYLYLNKPEEAKTYLREMARLPMHRYRKQSISVLKDLDEN